MTNKRTGYWYVFNIIYFVIITSCNLIFYDRISQIVFEKQSLFLIYQLILFYDLLLFFSLFLFKIKYGPFGSFKRVSFPKERIIREFTSFGRIGFFPIDNLISRWIVFENGLGIKTLWFIKIYIPRDNFKTLEKNTLIHDSLEVYNPIIIDEKIINQLKER